MKRCKYNRIDDTSPDAKSGGSIGGYFLGKSNAISFMNHLNGLHLSRSRISN